MSNHTKAWAIAREIPDHELREALIDAHERILDVADELDAPGDLDTAVYQATGWRDELQEAADKAECGTDGVADWIEDALEKLAKAEPPKEADGTPTGDLLARTQSRLEDALARINDLEIEREHFCKRVAELETSEARARHIPDEIKHAVGDVLAMSRKLTTFCEAAGIKPATIRVTRTRKKAS